MTAQKDLKNRIRARQAKTGEAYTAARIHVLRAGGSESQGRDFERRRIKAIVLKCNESSMRLRVPGENEELTFRVSMENAVRVAPGQFIEVHQERRWTWRENTYLTGTVKRSWTDISALGLEPLPLEDLGIYDLRETSEPFCRPEFYAEMWEFLTSTPRRACEFDGIAWGAGVGVDPNDAEACLVADASLISAQDPYAARKLLMGALHADLRCIDAHVGLGDLCFDNCPEQALTHYGIAVGIGDLSLGPSFDGLLPWEALYNRPFLRALHGCGLCLWRLGEGQKARRVFERVLLFNPNDNQGVRFSWEDILSGRPWPHDEELGERAHG